MSNNIDDKSEDSNSKKIVYREVAADFLPNTGMKMTKVSIKEVYEDGATVITEKARPTVEQDKK